MSEELQRDPRSSFDEAARAFIISTLKESIPEDVKKLERFFKPDLSVLHPRDRNVLRWKESNLK